MAAGAAEHLSIKAELLLFVRSGHYVSVCLPQLNYFKRWIMRFSAGSRQSSLLKPMTLISPGLLGLDMGKLISLELIL